MKSLPPAEHASRHPLLGLVVTYPSPGVIERIGADWDWIWIDAQHGDLDYRDVASLLRASDLVDRPALVRIPAHDPAWIGKALDAGAAGIIVPMVESLAEAAAMVRAAKFPPLGNRSFGGRRVIDRAGRGYHKTANQGTTLILQVESDTAVALADQLAEMPGVDGLFLGPDDLVIRVYGEVDTPKNRDTIGRQSNAVAAACHRHGKLSVCIGMTEPAVEMAVSARYSMIVGGGDSAFLAKGSKDASERLRAAVGASAKR